jgi:plastocyanin
MKNKLAVISLIALSLILVTGCGTQTKNINQAPTPKLELPAESAVSNTITILNFAFSPSTLTINKGETVTWINEDSAPHTIKFETFNSDTFNKGESYAKTFNEVGSFNYYCSIHPSMIGTIIVK